MQFAIDDTYLNLMYLNIYIFTKSYAPNNNLNNIYTYMLNNLPSNWIQVTRKQGSCPQQLTLPSFKLHNCKIVIKPDLSDVSVHIINTFQATQCEIRNMFYNQYKICEGTRVSCGTGRVLSQMRQNQWIYIRSVPSHPPNVSLLRRQQGTTNKSRTLVFTCRR